MNDVWLGTMNMYPIGWAECPETNSYLRGLYIDDETGSSGKYLIKEGRCSTAGLGYTDQPATCTNANWASVLDG